MEKDNKIDLTQYINPENELSKEMIQAYLDAAEMDTPDLWSGIEAGFEKEYEEVVRETRINKARKKKYWGIVAAVLLVTIIAVPVMLMQGDKSKGDKSDSLHVKNETATLDDMYNTELANHFYDGDSADMAASAESADATNNSHSGVNEEYYEGYPGSDQSTSGEYVEIEHNGNDEKIDSSGEVFAHNGDWYTIYINNIMIITIYLESK